MRTKGTLSPITAKLLDFKLMMAAAQSWWQLKGENRLHKVLLGIIFRGGTEFTASPDHGDT